MVDGFGECPGFWEEGFRVAVGDSVWGLVAIRDNCVLGRGLETGRAH